MTQYTRVSKYAKRKSKDGQSGLEKVYHCLNSWGLKDPFVTIPSKHRAILRIYRITPSPERIRPKFGEEVNGDGSGSYGLILDSQEGFP